jgi:hypothetical protein
MVTVERPLGMEVHRLGPTACARDRDLARAQQRNIPIPISRGLSGEGASQVVGDREQTWIRSS